MALPDPNELRETKENKENRSIEKFVNVSVSYDGAADCIWAEFPQELGVI